MKLSRLTPGKEKGENNTSDCEENSNASLDSEDANRLLNEIEINDFELSDQEDDDVEGGLIVWNIVNWEKRLHRDEIFSKRYKPSILEVKELKQTATELSVQTRGIMGMIQGIGSQMSQDLEYLLYGGHSIIVKRGGVSWQEKDCDLVLLTDGFLLVHRNFSSFNPLAKRYEFCHLWKETKSCYLQGDSFVILLDEGAVIELSSEDSTSWLHALEHILIEYALHNPSSEELTAEIGWQYGLVRRPAYTAAVTGDSTTMGDLSDVNTLDDYNCFAPLHYALQHETCNLEIIEKLLDAGADPNLEDNEGRTPMYFAEKNKLEDAKTLMENRGGEVSKLTNIEERGELFSRFEQSQINTARRREKVRLVEERKAAEAAEKAKSVQDQMNKNMAALIERGEKIEQLDNKTKDLEAEAKNFGVMATQLKEKMKKKKWYHL